MEEYYFDGRKKEYQSFSEVVKDIENSKKPVRTYLKQLMFDYSYKVSKRAYYEDSLYISEVSNITNTEKGTECTQPDNPIMCFDLHKRNPFVVLDVNYMNVKLDSQLNVFSRKNIYEIAKEQGFTSMGLILLNDNKVINVENKLILPSW